MIRRWQQGEDTGRLGNAVELPKVTLERRHGLAQQVKRDGRGTIDDPPQTAEIRFLAARRPQQEEHERRHEKRVRHALSRYEPQDLARVSLPGLDGAGALVDA